MKFHDHIETPLPVSVSLVGTLVNNNTMSNETRTSSGCKTFYWMNNVNSDGHESLSCLSEEIELWKGAWRGGKIDKRIQ